jgi:hypothetical protein
MGAQTQARESNEIEKASTNKIQIDNHCTFGMRTEPPFLLRVTDVDCVLTGPVVPSE